ncbi:hypothetical protein AAG906_019004 [Vitis piasezkii]
MAEQIPFSVVENVLSSLGSSVVQKMGSMYGVRTELRKLETTLGTLKAVLLDAEDHLEKSHAVKDWVKRLKGVVYDVDDLLDDFATYRLQRGGLVRQVSHFFSSSNQVAFRFQMSGRVDDIKEALDEIKRYLSVECYSTKHNSPTALVKLLVSPDKENVFIVAIVGIGGLGKTTLAQLVYDDERVQKHFEFMKWVCVSDHSGSEILVLRSYVNNIPEEARHVSLYLDLSFNEFNVLPNAITRLKNLQTLKLIKCWNLQRISNNIGELINLRHLENNGCYDLTHMPHGIGKLTLLQSLPLFVVGNDVGWLRNHKIGSLSELKGLNQLRGGLNISNLQNVRDVELSLRLEWNLSGQDGAYEGDKSVMEGLQPHPHLKDIIIQGYGGTEFPTWMMNDGLGSLMFKMQNSATLFSTPSLKSLKLHHMKELVELKEGSLIAPLFPSLESLKLFEIPKLKELWRMDLLAEEGPSFSHLSQLEITNCHNLASLELHSSPSLSQLEITNCPNLASFNVASLPRLEELSLGGVRAEVLRQLMFVSASSSLKSLRIWKIDGMISLPEEPLQHVSGLVTLQIRECPNLQSLELPSSHCLSKLEIINCPNLTSFNVASLPRLEELNLRGVRAEVLRQLMFVSASSSLKGALQYVSTLETLHIVKCSGLATLLHWMGSLSSLTELIIYDCYELTSLPEEIYSLKKLQKFYFCDYPHLEERYNKETGKDRAKIAHIPHVRFKCDFDMEFQFEEILRSDMITLNLKRCFVFGTLLHLIHTLTSLTELGNRGCPESTSLSEYMFPQKPADTK